MKSLQWMHVVLTMVSTLIILIGIFLFAENGFSQPSLSITVETTPTTAVVTFIHKNPQGIVRYEAYLYGQSGHSCSVEASAQHLRCTLNGIREASEFSIEARACFAGLYNCEPSILRSFRTKLRSPIDLKIDESSTTSVRATVIPPADSAATFYEVSIVNPQTGPNCRVYFGKSPPSCAFKDLKPGTTYGFTYRLGVTRSYLDIVSESRHKSFTMPSVSLSITVQTSITTATVTFLHKNPKGIAMYEAYVNSLEGNKCTVAAGAKPLQCTLKGIPEASNFNVVARACFSVQGKCEPPIEVAARTELRDAVDLKFDVLSSTSLSATVIPPTSSAADYFVVYFRNPKYSGYCTVYFGSGQKPCIYKELIPGHKYDFVYHLGASPGGLDISSGNRYKSFTMPRQGRA